MEETSLLDNVQVGSVVVIENSRQKVDIAQPSSRVERIVEACMGAASPSAIKY